jgi:hypothetical protein
MKTKIKLMAMVMMVAALGTVPEAQGQNSIWGYTNLGAAPATDDKLLLYDTSATATKNMTVANLFTSPTFTTPVLGVATATSVNGLTITSSTGTLTVTNGKTLAVSNSLTFTGTDSSSVAFGAGGTVVYLSTSQTLTNKTLTSPTLTTPSLGVASATSVTATGALVSTGTAGVGYASGAGGTVTQGTSKSTGVTINKTSGQITMNSASLADATNVSFTVTNSTVAATDTISVNHGSAGTAGAYQVQANAVGSGSFKVTVRNVSGGSLGEAIVINFNVIKGASS